MTDPRNDPNNEQHHPVPVTKLAISWTIAGVPLLWGVYQTFLRSLALFE